METKEVKEAKEAMVPEITSRLVNNSYNNPYILDGFIEYISDKCDILPEYKDRFTDYVIGGSEIGAIMKLSIFSTPFDIYKRKKQKVKTEETRAMKMGKRGEFYTLEDYANMVNSNISSLNKSVLVSKKNPRFVASLDAVGYDTENKEYYVIECKNTFKDINSQDDILLEYYLQVQWYLGITGLRYGHLVFSKYLDYYKHFKITREDDLIETMFNYANDWIEKYLIGDEKPEYINMKDILENLEIDKKKSVVIPEDLYSKYLKFLELDNKRKELENECNKIKEEIELYVATKKSYYIFSPDGKKIGTFISGERENYDIQKLKKEYPDIFDKIRKPNTKFAYIKFEKNSQ